MERRNKSSRRTPAAAGETAQVPMERRPSGDKSPADCLMDREIHGVIRIRSKAGTFDVHRAEPGKSGGKLVHPLPGASPERNANPFGR